MIMKFVVIIIFKVLIVVIIIMGIKVLIKVVFIVLLVKGIFFCLYISLEKLVRKFNMYKCYFYLLILFFLYIL